jgi:hypothetical protein
MAAWHGGNNEKRNGAQNSKQRQHQRVSGVAA